MNELWGGHMTTQGAHGGAVNGSLHGHGESYCMVPPIDSSGGASDRTPLDGWRGFSLEATPPHILSHMPWCVAIPDTASSMATNCDVRLITTKSNWTVVCCRLSMQCFVMESPRVTGWGANSGALLVISVYSRRTA